MPRAKAILQSDFPYNISARCINREWFNLPMDTVWEIFCEQLEKIHDSHNLKVHSFILMSNHFHMIATTPDANISQCMQQFMYRTSKALTRKGNRINETFAGRHFKCILDDYSYYMNAYKYNYRNPVAAGICAKVEEYKYSSLNALLRDSHKPAYLIHDALFSDDPVGILRWLNTAPDFEKLEAVRWGLKHQYFRPKKEPKTNKTILHLGDVM